MALKDLLPSPTYNKKILDRFEKPHNCGSLKSVSYFYLATGSASHAETGIKITLYLLVDITDGVVTEAKFQALAPPLLIAACDVLCSQILRKNHAVASKTKQEAIYNQLDDHTIDCRLILEALERACLMCEMLPKTPLPSPSHEDQEGIPGWLTLSDEERLAHLGKILDEEVKPYVELDEGGIEVVELRNGLELKIAYKGACTTCYSSVGATLQSIQEILQRKIHPQLVVEPDMSSLGL